MDFAHIRPSSWHTELRNARRRERLSQGQLASRTGLPQSHISRIENGAVDPRLSSVVKVAQAVGFDPMLIPRRAVPAVLSVLRSFEESAAGRQPSAIELLVGDGEGDDE